jgi:phosphatidate cytidylyltransferase
VITRLVAAVVGLAVLLPAIIFGGELAVEILVPIAGVICLSEYAGMAFPDDRVVGTAWLTVVAGLVYGVALYASGFLALAVGAAVVGTLVLNTMRPGETLEGTADTASRYLLGAGWICLLGSLVSLRRLDHGLAWIFLVLAVSWLGDTGGYFAGKYLGTHKLYPRVSPKKTWEGVAGGITLATVGTFAVRAIGLPELSVIDCLVLGPLACTAGVVGDLSESMLKRSYDVKDSGWIIPGHGGLLDRIDSVLFVAPMLFAYATWMQG